MPYYYTDSRYTFTDPVRTHKGKRCGVRRYIKYLEQIAKCNAKGYEPTRKEVQVALGDPDPSQPNDWNRKQIARCKRAGLDYKNLERGSNWGISRWTAMRQAGLICGKRVGSTVRYQLTAGGALLLHSVL